MDSESDIFSKTSQYLKGEIALEALEDWLIPRLPLFLSLPDDDVVSQLVGTIELGRAEMSNEIIDENQLRESVQAFLASVETIHVRFGGFQTASGSSNEVVTGTGFLPIGEEPHVTVVHR